MAKRDRERARIDVSGQSAPAPTLAGLLRGHGLPVSEGAASPKPAAAAAAPAASASAPDLSRAGPFYLRRETKGRRGKTVTLVRGPDHKPPPVPLAELAALARALARALGCGAALEGESIVIQGDQRERAATWLRQAGASKVHVA